jgi:hypothetical protein
MIYDINFFELIIEYFYFASSRQSGREDFTFLLGGYSSIIA